MHFSKLLARVKRGEEIVVTHRGKPIAKLVPVGSAINSDAALAAFRRLKAIGRRAKLGRFDWEEWKTYRDVGRR
jgi:antitoxin (DNA-binding transcriptional repressor) of toxin-antitoxin stability system